MDMVDFEVSTKIFSHENFILQHNSMQYFENFIHKTARFVILRKFQPLKILRLYNTPICEYKTSNTYLPLLSSTYYTQTQIVLMNCLVGNNQLNPINLHCNFNITNPHVCTYV